MSSLWRLTSTLLLAGSLTITWRANAQVTRDNLLVFHDGQGSVQPVRTREEWESRRQAILRAAQEIMGPLTGPEKTLHSTRESGGDGLRYICSPAELVIGEQWIRRCDRHEAALGQFRRILPMLLAQANHHIVPEREQPRFLANVLRSQSPGCGG